ncbi:MAG TPA: hypothetical protein VIV07_03825, partial [Sphingomicrobium sp.]
CVLAIMGDNDASLKMLESTLSAVGEYQVRIAENDPDFDGLRDDPRFDKLIQSARKRLGMAEAQAG